jgi:hypothetical protein
MFTANKDTIIGSGTTNLASVGYNGLTESNGVALSTFLYVQKVIEFAAFTSSNTMTFNFAGLPSQHEKVIARARVFTECSAQVDRTIQMTLSGDAPEVVNQILTANTESIVQGEVLHTASTLTLTIVFGVATQNCRKIVQDITLYSTTCKDFCGSNVCPSSGTYYMHPNTVECVSECPNGYKISGNLCVPIALCHSTCNACQTANDASQCSSCSSTFTTSFPYDTLTPPGACTLPLTNNAQLLLTINKNTILDTSKLKSVVFGSGPTTVISGSNSASGLYIENVIEFKALTSNTVVFNLGDLPVHQKIFVRARVFTTCDGSMTNSNFIMTMDTESPATYPVPQNT